MKSKPNLLGLFVLVVPNTALAYGASGGAIFEFASLCILIPLGSVIFFSTGYLKRKAPVILYLAFALIGFLSIVGVLGMVWSFTTEVGYRPVVLGMHTLLVIFVFFAAKHIYRVLTSR